MASKENSFDIVSEVDMQEIDNALNQARREIQTRFDFKGSKSEIKFDGKTVTLISDDDFKLKNVVDILESKAIKRGIDLKAFKYGKVETAAGDTVRQSVEIIQGIETDLGKQIVKDIKNTKLKVQASIQGDKLRVSGKNRDDLQAVIKLVKEKDYKVPLQFTNYRSG
ncbi:MAG: YajQ family cyclic di-GMP-binding protein [Firmicutes bacterium HGW-Firmicutes-14]|nr:MAG: YajQ family cyclic di-GMP-binding protein [Firmicutes bacterium HGW-Firmicutes-14]